MKTPKLLAAAIAACALSGVAGADLLINEICDGDLSGGLPKWVELRNTGATSVDVTVFEIKNYNNGSVLACNGFACPALTGGPLAAGDYYMIAYEVDPGTNTSAYSSVYSDTPDLYTGGSFINGDDVVTIETGAGIVDVYGVLGVNGDFEVWDYTDGYAFRIGSTASATFDTEDWVYGGRESLRDPNNPFPGSVPIELGYLTTFTSPRAQTMTMVGNPILTSNYCTAGTSTSGCNATISAVGTASASATEGFIVSATGVEGDKDGLFFYGQNGQQNNSWGNGTSYQCVVTPVKRGGLRTGVGTSGSCDGAASQDLNARWCPTCPKSNHNPAPGLMQLQFWYRDPFNTSNQTTSLTDAIEVTVAP